MAKNSLLIEPNSQRKTATFKIMIFWVAICAILVFSFQFTGIRMRNNLASKTAVQTEQSSADKTFPAATTLSQQTTAINQTTNFIWITISVLILILFALLKRHRQKNSH